MTKKGFSASQQIPNEDPGIPNQVAGERTSRDCPKETAWQKLQSLSLRAAALFGAFLLLAGLLAGSAGFYTSRPDFCRSCHNMEPYYDSWQHSSHKAVSCIKCHFPPGVGEEVRGKMLGLVQLAKYVTRSEGPRPAAEVSDASCLRSGCHEKRLLSGKIEYHGILFDHRPHMEEVRSGKKLRCTSCHSQIVQGEHMTVTTSTCFLCHFKDGHFNEGLQSCTRCHQIPDQPFDLGGGTIFHHDLAYEQGVDCANCHGDLIRGNGEVPHERCTVCHNREEDLSRITEIKFLHQKHVTEHKVDCLECHLEIQHSFDTEKIQHAASDCTSCHPDHHREQVAMLEGDGGKSISTHSNGMIVARIACPSCHRTEDVSVTGTVLRKASMEACLRCHDESATQRLTSHYETVKTALADLAATVAHCREALDSAKLKSDRKTDLKTQLDTIESDLNFLQAANPVHNIHYATSLARILLEQLSSLCKELGLDAPNITLPEKAEQTE